MTVQHTDPATAEDRISAIRARLDAAQEHLGDICTSKQRFRMSIPADPSRDSDLIFGAALEDAESLLSELEAAQARLAEVERELDEQRHYGEQIQMSLDSCSGNHLPIEEYPGDARALGLGEEDTGPVPADAAPVIVYGASDDLIELRGAVYDEIGAHYERATTIRVDLVNGQHVWLQAEYDPDGTGQWRIQPVSGHGRVLRDGHELVTIVPARGEDEGDDADGCPGYSDKAIVRGGVAVEREEGDDVR